MSADVGTPEGHGDFPVYHRIRISTYFPGRGDLGRPHIDLGPPSQPFLLPRPGRPVYLFPDRDRLRPTQSFPHNSSTNPQFQVTIVSGGGLRPETVNASCCDDFERILTDGLSAVRKEWCHRFHPCYHGPRLTPFCFIFLHLY
jgi:hypothetical protein